jgi:hypothetical protein
MAQVQNSATHHQSKNRKTIQMMKVGSATTRTMSAVVGSRRVMTMGTIVTVIVMVLFVLQEERGESPSTLMELSSSYSAGSSKIQTDKQHHFSSTTKQAEIVSSLIPPKLSSRDDPVNDEIMKTEEESQKLDEVVPESVHDKTTPKEETVNAEDEEEDVAVVAEEGINDEKETDKGVEETSVSSRTATNEKTISVLDPKLDLSAYHDCKISPIPAPQNAAEQQKLKSAKAFWVPSYPISDAGIFSRLVNGLTGIPSGSKNYYASSKAQKKCFGVNMITVSCEQIHPVVGIGASVTRLRDRFQDTILLPLRNPATVIPAHFQNKAESYHGAVGQVDMDRWREFRDSWLELSVMEGWNSVIEIWKNMTEYSGIGLYLSYEHLLDVTKGPAVTKELATILRNAGFPVAREEDIPCVWYHATHHRLVQDHIHYEFAVDYIPGYTVEQKEFVISQLERLQHEFADDLALAAILNEYIQEIRLHTPTDIPWVNKTAKGV